VYVQDNHKVLSASTQHWGAFCHMSHHIGQDHAQFNVETRFWHSKVLEPNITP
jgi:hypothetical protein